MKVAILDDWFNTIPTLPCFKKLEGMDVTVFTDHQKDTNVLVERLLPFDVIVLFRERTSITSDLLSALPHLKLISQRSVYPHVDVAGCTRYGVLLCSNMHTDMPSFAAAEHTWALTLAAMRQLPQQMKSLQSGQWQIGVGKTLRGRVIGLYGYGRIAKIVAQYAHAFGMQVMWWGSDQGRKRAHEDGCTVAQSREMFFASSDVVSVHVRLKSETKGVITEQDFSHMREGTLFVNTSRASIVEKGALLNALNQGRPSMAALDVFDQEPITWRDDSMACHPRVVATPHIGFVTEDELEIQFADIFDQVVAYRNNKPINMINPEVLV